MHSVLLIISSGVHRTEAQRGCHLGRVVEEVRAKECGEAKLIMRGNISITNKPGLTGKGHKRLRLPTAFSVIRQPAPVMRLVDKSIIS